MDLRAWYLGAARELPWRGTTDPYRILVSEMMLQQTTVAAVIPRYLAWIRQFPDASALASAKEQDVLTAWQGLGYYSRARRLQEAARQITTECNGQWPRHARELVKLPGVGAYTAAAVASFAFGEAVPTIDANVARVVARLDAISAPVDSADGRRLIEASASALLDQVLPATHNNAMMELGATVCLPRSPRCDDCPVAHHCKAATLNPEDFPAKKPRPAVTRSESMNVFILSRRRLLLRQQQGPRWAGLWALPEADLPGITVEEGSMPLLTLYFPITRYQVTLRVLKGKLPGRLPGSCRWWPLDKLANCPMPSPHRRAIETLLSRIFLNRPYQRVAAGV